MRKITGFQRLLRRAGLFGAPLAAALWLTLGGSGMAHDAHVVLGLAIWMALCWMPGTARCASCRCGSACAISSRS